MPAIADALSGDHEGRGDWTDGIRRGKRCDQGVGVERCARVRAACLHLGAPRANGQVGAKVPTCVRAGHRLGPLDGPEVGASVHDLVVRGEHPRPRRVQRGSRCAHRRRRMIWQHVSTETTLYRRGGGGLAVINWWVHGSHPKPSLFDPRFSTSSLPYPPPTPLTSLMTA